MAFKEVAVNKDGIPHETGNLKILNVTTGSVYPETLEDIRNYQIAWDRQSRGFFYFSQVRCRAIIDPFLKLNFKAFFH